MKFNLHQCQLLLLAGDDSDNDDDDDKTLFSNYTSYFHRKFHPRLIPLYWYYKNKDLSNKPFLSSYQIDEIISIIPESSVPFLTTDYLNNRNEEEKKDENINNVRENASKNTENSGLDKENCSWFLKILTSK
ncbi:hypothetical protein Glove_520g10 [Diversispora epigaea]|uniref:Uncharacterized protein n=1 Tax=Diversispora epigaea TaxID=1348612 RepID=A0A397GJ66_9GLOM|nr:hypothetical protein Glove_520g10 [Diversispora epigaea]